MAQSQLPPKVPTMMHNWPSSSPFHMMLPPPPPMPSTTTTSAATSHQNFWVDEFLEFSSARRNAHRRSISDPIAFIETSEQQQCGLNINIKVDDDDNHGGFERLDDEQLRKMFWDDVSPAVVPEMGGDGRGMSSSTGTSTPPLDENGGNNHDHHKIMPVVPHSEDKMMPKREPEEEDAVVESDSSSKPITATHAAEEDGSGSTKSLAAANNGSTDTFVDPKRIKRILANRQSAQRSRVRKLQYISELERSVTTLQTEVSTLSPRVAYLDHQRLILNVDNSVLKQRIAALAQDKIFKDAHQEALRKEIERLRQIYHEQNAKKVVDTGAATGTTTPNNHEQDEAASQPPKGS